MANGIAIVGNIPMFRCGDDASYVLFLMPSWNFEPPFYVPNELNQNIKAIIVLNHSQEGMMLTSGLWKFNPNLPEKRVFVSDIDKPYNFCKGWEQWQMGPMNDMIKVHPLPDHLIISDLEIFIDKKTGTFAKVIQNEPKHYKKYYGYIGTNIEIDEDQTEVSHICGTIAKDSLKKASELWIDSKNYVFIDILDDYIQGNTIKDLKVFKKRNNKWLPNRIGVINPAIEKKATTKKKRL